MTMRDVDRDPNQFLEKLGESTVPARKLVEQKQYRVGRSPPRNRSCDRSRWLDMEQMK